MKNMFSNKLTSQLLTIYWITIIWVIVSVSHFIRGYLTLREFNCLYDEINAIDYLMGSILVGVLAGLIGGSAIVFFWGKWLRTKTYGVMLLYLFGSFTIIYIIVDFLSGLYALGAEASIKVSTSMIFSNLLNIETLYNYLTWLVVILATTIVLQVNDKYGPGVFKDFLLGKYFHPRKEERIFMFLDMRSSTTIAEKLGAEKYFNLIRKLFSDATDPIIYSNGEIYQYVGDEIIVSWKMKNGITRASCVNCFFEIQKKILQNKVEYLDKYGIVPEFKAGLHYGNVMAGEVGVVKRDIAFSGDVLNTTARIQEKCNELGVNILISEMLIKKLTLPNKVFNPKNMGEMVLRGKSEKLSLYTL